MAKKKIFVSYDYDNDRTYKNLLLAWDKNSEFDFAMSDQSADVSIESDDAAAIKRAISAKINAATYFLCIIGTKTSKSEWVAWEIEKAKDLSKPACSRQDGLHERNTARTLGSRCLLGNVVHLRSDQEGHRQRLKDLSKCKELEEKRGQEL